MVVLRAVFVPHFFGGDRGESRLSRARPLGRCNRPDRSDGTRGRNRCNGDGRSRRRNGRNGRNGRNRSDGRNGTDGSRGCNGRHRCNGRGGDGGDLRFCFGIFYAERAGNGGRAAHI